MPQMSPMWWTMIYSSTLMSIMIMVMVMFYWKNNKIIKSNLKTSFNNKNWKW